MEEKIENSLMALLDTLEQAEVSAYRHDDFSNLIALAKVHLVAMHFYDNESEAICEGLENVYVPEPPKEDDAE